MRQLLLAFAFLCLSACGNANTGKAFNPYSHSSTSAQTAVASATPSASSQPLYCRSPLLASSEYGISTAFSGSVVCALQAANATVGAKGASVLFRANAGVAANTPLCMIPFVNDSAETETCFLANGQTTVALTTDQYTSIVVVPQAYLAAYKLYEQTPGTLAPPRVLYSM